jgi:hypothetical protein
MFYVSVRIDKTDNRIFYICPECHTQSVYFTVIPTICEICDCPLPNPEKMEKSQLTRYNYHISVKK